MNRFRKVAVGIILLELLAILICNALFYHHFEERENRNYKIDISRVTTELEARGLEAIDLSKYDTILGVEVYDSSQIVNDDYTVEEVDGVLYRIRYIIPSDYSVFLYVNAAFMIMLIVTSTMLVYMRKKFIGPFHRMSDMTLELAKGNLSRPVKEEKSRYFGRFLWGMDMLRENLEAKAEKELSLQKEKKGLLLSLSHDIKTPLSAIELYNKGLLTGLYETEERRGEAYQGIERNIQEIKNYVDEIITASREDFLDLEVQSGEFYLSKGMKRIEEYYREKLAILHTEFELEAFEDCLLKGDENRFVEVLQNVIENAIKYGDGKRITIQFDEEEDCRLITVVNTGEGIAEEEMANIFDSFYRGSNSKGEKGSGLGLYICRNLMRKMDGDIFAKVAPGRFGVTVVARKM